MFCSFHSTSISISLLFASASSLRPTGQLENPHKSSHEDEASRTEHGERNHKRMYDAKVDLMHGVVLKKQPSPPQNSMIRSKLCLDSSGLSIGVVSDSQELRNMTRMCLKFQCGYTCWY